MKDSDIVKIVKENDGGVIHLISPPARYGKISIWEIWTKADGEFHTRYVLENAKKETAYYSDFQSLCFFLHDEGGANKNENFSLWVSAIVFVLSTCALLWMLISKNADPTKTTDVPGTALAALLGGLIASGGWRFFGRWIQPKL